MYHDGCRMLVEEMGAKTVVKMTNTQRLNIEPNQRVDCHIRSIDEVTTDYGDRIRWRFETENGAEYTRFTGSNMGEGAVAGVFVRSLVGELPAEFDTDVLLGMPVTIVGGINAKGNPAIQEVVRRQGEYKDFGSALPDPA